MDALAAPRPRRFASRSALSEEGGVEDSAAAPAAATATAPGVDAFATARPRLFADSSFVALAPASSCLSKSGFSTFATDADTLRSSSARMPFSDSFGLEDMVVDAISRENE